MTKNQHILNAASNLLGISLLIIAGLHIGNRAATTVADEVAWGAAFCFSVSCLVSYLSLRSEAHHDRLEDAADKLFLAGMLSLIVAVIILATAPRL